MSMENTEVVRMRCPTCERRLEVPTNIKFVACTRCGSEYSVNKQGGTLTLTPYLDQVQELNEQIVRAEQAQAGGCANLTFTSVGLGLLVFFIFGMIGLFFNRLALGCLLGWGLAVIIIVAGFSLAGRYVNRNQMGLDQLQQAREQAAHESSDEPAAGDVVNPAPEAQEGSA